MTLELHPLKIGSLTIPSPVVLAALAGYSDHPYRMICRRLGAPYCATEAMLDRQMLLDGKLRRRLVHLTDEDHPIAGQIMGNDPAVMAASARELCLMGFDVVDLNFACPVRKVLSRRRGGWMMSQPDRVIEITRAVAAVVDRPLTLKLRRAFQTADQVHDAFWRIAEAAFDAGVAAICVHGRSVEQKYTGKADWEFIASVKRRFAGRTILGSGDILTPADAIAMLRQTGVDGVTLARGVIGNPWMFRQVADLAAGRLPYRPNLDEQRQLLADHFDAVCRLFGTRRGPKIIRKFSIKYARMHPTPHKVRLAFIGVQTRQQWQAVLDEYYRAPQGAMPSAAGSAD
jgi:nifR3 family TIM-barrel protein